MESLSFAAYFNDVESGKDSGIIVYDAKISTKSAQLELSPIEYVPNNLEEYVGEILTASGTFDFTVEMGADGPKFSFQYQPLNLLVKGDSICLSSDRYQTVVRRRV